MTKTKDVEPFYRAFGEMMAAARLKAQLTQVDLAKKLGKPRSSIAGMEVGNQRIHLHDAVRLSRILDMPLDTLDKSARKLLREGREIKKKKVQKRIEVAEAHLEKLLHRAREND